jgi:hypothetical protein
MGCKFVIALTLLLVTVCESFAAVPYSPSSNQSNHQYDDYVQYYTYRNERFGFYLRYPSYLRPFGEPTNGDGNTFYSREGDVRVVCCAQFQMGGESTQVLYYEEKASCLRKGCRITYEFAKNGKVVLSGYTKEGRIFYKKIVLCTLYGPGYGCNVDVIAYVDIEYKESRRSDGEEIVNLIKNFPYLP